VIFLQTPSATHFPSTAAVVIGGGPAGLMAAEVIAQAGFSVAIYDAMPSMGRKFLLAGVGGMNITHAEASPQFLARYNQASASLAPIIQSFDAENLRRWAHELGIETFVGTSGRVFPKEMKAAPLLRAWLHRLREAGVKFFPRHRWQGWTDEGHLRFSVATRDQEDSAEKIISAQVCVLALGGASWPRLGSDGSWIPLLRERHIRVADLQPSNCGFDVAWSEHFRARCAGEPLNTVTLSVTDAHGITHHQRGECTVTANGLEGNAIYALSATLRDSMTAGNGVDLLVDLLPDYSEEKIVTQLKKPRGKESLSNFLRKQLKLAPVKIQLLRECAGAAVWQDDKKLAACIKAVPVRLLRTRPLGEAISSAGGVMFSSLDEYLMLRDIPGVFCAGEMLDWEAPTGGYLLTACFATGRAAGLGATIHLQQCEKIPP
jgi:uncharacterized flavoprotein (TIGR03862 family)